VLTAIAGNTLTIRVWAKAGLSVTKVQKVKAKILAIRLPRAANNFVFIGISLSWDAPLPERD